MSKRVQSLACSPTAASFARGSRGTASASDSRAAGGGTSTCMSSPSMLTTPRAIGATAPEDDEKDEAEGSLAAAFRSRPSASCAYRFAASDAVAGRPGLLGCVPVRGLTLVCVNLHSPGIIV